MSMLKSLAQKAKYRLRMVSEEDDIKYSEACLSAKVQYAIIASQKKIENDPIYNKVKRILSREEETLFPLSELIEDKNFSSLENGKKERYLLSLSKRYNQIKEHLDTETAKAI